MHKTRLEAFSDAVIAILMTIMVLELKAPHTHDFEALTPLLPTFLAYLLSFVYLGIYWNNHHHLLQIVTRVSGQVLWANMNLLFWLSLIPFATAWMAEAHFERTPVMVYGLILIMSGTAYYFLTRALIYTCGQTDELRTAIGADHKGLISVVIYAVAIGLSFLSAWLALALYVAVAIMWIIPDRRIERVVRGC